MIIAFTIDSARTIFPQIKVTGKVETPWFGDKLGINVAWRFLVNSKEKIFFVGIDILASPQELINLGLVP